jgi:uncharacterized protein
MKHLVTRNPFSLWGAVAAVLAISLVVCVSARGEDPSGDLKKQLIDELVAIMEADQTAQKTADAIMTQMAAQYPQMLSEIADSGKILTSGQKERMKQEAERSFTRFAARFRERLGDIYRSKELLERVYYPTFSKYYTKAELRDLITFYKSPTGQKTLRVQPEFTSDVLQRSFELIGPKMQHLIKELMEEELDYFRKEKTEAG